MFEKIAGFFGMPPEKLRDGIVLIFLSIILTAFVRYIIKLIAYISSFKRKDVRTGKKYIYHYTMNEEGECFLYPQSITIRRSILKGYKVFITDIGKTQKLYKGTLVVEGSNFIFHLTSTFHAGSIDKETIAIRMKRNFALEQGMAGLYLGFSFNSRIYSTTCLITLDKNLNEISYDDRIRKHFSMLPDKFFVFEK